MSPGSRHITWDAFRQQVLEPGLPARLAVGGAPPVWLSLRGRALRLSTPVPDRTKVPVSPLAQITVTCTRERGCPVLEIATEREDLYREFFFLGLGIVDMIQSRGRAPYDAFAEALATWKELLRSASRLSDDQQLGLTGELWLLDRLLDRNGPGGLDAWMGPRGEPHDFRTGRVEFEVKSTRSATRIHVVNGLRQLVPSRRCRLCVVSLQWEPAGNADGETLPSRIARVRARLASSPGALALFNDLLRDRLHYRDEDAPLYADRLRLRTAPRLIEVGPGMPRITPEMLSGPLGETSARIDDVTYQVNLEGLGVEEGSAMFKKLLP